MRNFDRWSTKAIIGEVDNMEQQERQRAQFQLHIREGQGEHSSDQYEAPALPGMEIVDFIEAMSPEERIEHKRRYLSEISDREQLCRMIDDANHMEGVNIDIVGWGE